MLNESLDLKFMNKALKEAKKAFDKDEVPIGAIVVDQIGNIIGRGHNLSESLNSQLKHAEILAINNASKKIKDWRLSDCTIYITVEPCVMCLGLIGLSRVKRVVFGAKSPHFGSDIDNLILPDLYKRHIVEILGGILKEESLELLKKFFKNKRLKK